MTAPAPGSGRELHSRYNGGIHVRLMWCQRDGRPLLWVVVSDAKAGAEFSVEVSDPGGALDVFHHPYAYAALYGVETQATPGDAARSTSVPA